MREKHGVIEELMLWGKSALIYGGERPLLSKGPVCLDLKDKQVLTRG